MSIFRRIKFNPADYITDKNRDVLDIFYDNEKILTEDFINEIYKIILLNKIFPSTKNIVQVITILKVYFLRENMNSQISSLFGIENLAKRYVVDKFKRLGFNPVEAYEKCLMYEERYAKKLLANSFISDEMEKFNDWVNKNIDKIIEILFLTGSEYIEDLLCKNPELMNNAQFMITDDTNILNYERGDFIEE